MRKTRLLAQQKGVDVAAFVGDLAVFDLGHERWDLVVSIFAHMPAAVRRDLHARVVREGSGHSGLSAVVQVIARKRPSTAD